MNNPSPSRRLLVFADPGKHRPADDFDAVRSVLSTDVPQEECADEDGFQKIFSLRKVSCHLNYNYKA